MLARRTHDREQVALDRLGDVDGPANALGVAQLLGRDDRGQLLERAGQPEATQDRPLLLGGRVAERLCMDDELGARVVVVQRIEPGPDLSQS